MNAYIFTGGQVFADTLDELELVIRGTDLTIAADSGYLCARRLGVKPDLLIGDLDSLDKNLVAQEELDEIAKIIVPSIKDDTDTQLALDTAISRGAQKVFIIGGLGGRLDHTLSTAFLLEYAAQKGVQCILTDGKNRVRLMRSGEELCIPRGRYKYLSLISLCDVCKGVSVCGVFYELNSATISRSYSYAISNEITKDFAGITLDEGIMLVIESND